MKITKKEMICTVWQEVTEKGQGQRVRPQPSPPNLLLLVIQGFLNLFLLFLDKLQFRSCENGDKDMTEEHNTEYYC